MKKFNFLFAAVMMFGSAALFQRVMMTTMWISDSRLLLSQYALKRMGLS